VTPEDTSALGEEDPGSALDTLDIDPLENTMPLISEVMTRQVQVVGPEDTLERAAQLMAQLNVGSLPVCHGRELIGMVTDHDITVRGSATGADPTRARVSAVMTRGTPFCTQDQDSHEVLRLMGRLQVRRLPVLGPDGKLMGIVSLGDFALRHRGPVGASVRELLTLSCPDGGPTRS
jgi:CBS domain-containing protein